MLAYGTFELLEPDHEQIYAFGRALPEADHELRVVCNFTDQEPAFEVPDTDGEREVVLANYDSPPTAPSTATLRPYEAIVYRV